LAARRGIRATVSEITGRLWGDLPPDGLAVAGRVLRIVTERAGAEPALILFGRTYQAMSSGPLPVLSPL